MEDTHYTEEAQQQRPGSQPISTSVYAHVNVIENS